MFGEEQTNKKQLRLKRYLKKTSWIEKEIDFTGHAGGGYASEPKGTSLVDGSHGWREGWGGSPKKFPRAMNTPEPSEAGTRSEKICFQILSSVASFFPFCWWLPHDEWSSQLRIERAFRSQVGENMVGFCHALWVKSSICLRLC